MALGPIIGNTPIWWEIQNISDEMVEELRRRNNSYNTGQNYPQNVNFNFERDREKYKGPMTPWVRVFSNGTGKSLNTLTPPSRYLKLSNDFDGYDGFILKGADGFFDVFGYDKSTGLKDKKAIIGYQANGLPHYLEGNQNQLNYNVQFDKNFPQRTDVPRILPPPGIESVNIKQSKDFLTYASFKFKCYSLAQVEYLTPFFLNPGINIFIEFGWNLFNQNSLVELNNPKKCWELVSKPQTALDRGNLSNGNYGCVTGIITKYNFSTQDGFVYECTVEMTSRQGLYAGLRIDNSVTSKDSNNNLDDRQFLNLKDFIKFYLPSINDVIRQPKNITSDGTLNPLENFYTYVKYNLGKIADKNSESIKSKNDSEANRQQLDKQNYIQQQPNLIDKIQGFYKGKPEDRIFTGRRYDVYKKGKSPEIPTDARGRPTNSRIEAIKYESINGKNQYSLIDKNDFDANDNDDQIWMQLDFVFEIFNLFMSSNEKYKIDIDDIIINAHPNLMSLNRDFLIPNPVSPKINKGRNNPTDGSKTGYLKGNASLVSDNIYLSLKSDLAIKSAEVKKTVDKLGNNEKLTPQEGLNIAAFTVRNKFKTAFYERDNIDTIINNLYYNSPNNNPEGSAAFPFKIETYNYDEDGTPTNNTPYKPYYFGYLKHLYISKTKLMDIVTNSDVKNYKELIKTILDFINTSVDDFWKFDIVDRPDGKGLTIVDKNGVGNLTDIYTFDIASTNNVVRSITFDVSLSNEQSVNVLFGGSPDQNLSLKYKKDILKIADVDSYKTTFARLTNEPPLKFADRMDSYELSEYLTKRSGSLNESVTPGTPSGLFDENNDIAYLQTYGEKKNVLTMRVGYFKETKVTYDDLNSPTLETNIKFLNWPESMKGMLRSILTDGDTYNNIKYSGVADNFTITLVFDGIFGFRNLQCFAIKNLPKPYVPGNVIFQVLEAEHQIESGKWTTVVTALVRCVGGNVYNYVTV